VHSTIQITLDRYGHLFEDDAEEITTGLDGLYAMAVPETRPNAEVVELAHA
jgi:hypothetical protein